MTYSDLTGNKIIQNYKDIERLIGRLAGTVSELPLHIKETTVVLANIFEKMLYDESQSYRFAQRIDLEDYHDYELSNPEDDDEAVIGPKKHTIQSITREDFNTLFHHITEKMLRQAFENHTNVFIIVYDYFYPPYEITRNEKKTLFALVAPHKFKRTKGKINGRTYICHDLFLPFEDGMGGTEIYVYKPTRSSYKLVKNGAHSYASDNFGELLQFFKRLYVESARVYRKTKTK